MIEQYSRRAAVVVACLLAGAGGCTTRETKAPPVKERPNILLVTIDTWRADRLDARRTPAIHALASRGVRFTTARTPVPLTLPAHASLVTGVPPWVHGVRENGTARLAADRPTLASSLRPAGYRTGAFVAAYVLDRRFGLDQGFETYDDQVPRDPLRATSLEAERRGNVVVDRALGWLGGVDVAKPFFAWVHLFDPHAPYDPPAEFKARVGGDAYDGEVAFADAQVGRLLEWLSARQLGSKTVVVVAGDHGEGLGEHGEHTHGLLLYDSTLRVPLVVAGPGIEAGVRSEPASLLDVAPTLLDLAGVARPAGVTGVNLLASTITRDREIAGETRYPRVVGWSPLVAVVAERWKLIRSSEDELFDLQNDPSEVDNVAQRNVSVARAMSARAAALEAEGRSASVASDLSSEARARLQALGYVAPSAAAVVREGAPNPARHIGAWNRFEAAWSQLGAGGADAAGKELGRLVKEYPDSSLFASIRARALRQSGQRRAALEAYRQAVRRWPGDSDLMHELAVAARESGLPGEALRAEQAALVIDPRNSAAHNGLGLVHSDAGRHADAVVAFANATDLDPTNASYWVNLGNARRASADATGASKAYMHALEVDPRAVDAMNGLGVLLVQQGRASEAVPWFERALSVSPDFVEARLNLGIAWQEQGNKSRAAEAYREVLDAPQSIARDREAARQLLASLGSTR